MDGVVQTLLERGLIEQRGRAEVVGRPMTYGTTSYFLEYFGLKSLDDLPAAPELQRIEVERPEALQTAEPDLETVDPEDGDPVVIEDDSADADPTELSETEETTAADSPAEPANDVEESETNE